MRRWQAVTYLQRKDGQKETGLCEYLTEPKVISVTVSRQWALWNVTQRGQEVAARCNTDRLLR
jgi:hypothetical protein